MNKAAIHTNPKDNWGTPSYIMEAVRAALGGTISLDPASTPRDNEVVGAERIYTSGALVRDWDCPALFCNPPYGSGLKGRDAAAHKMAWTLKWHEARCFAKALLMPASVEQPWFQMLAADRDLYHFCFPDARVKFRHPETDKEQPGNAGPSVIIYYGENAAPLRELGVLL